MPLIDAAGTSVDRIRPDSGEKNSMPPERIWPQHVGVGTELVVGKNLQVDAAVGLGLDGGGHFPGTHIHRMAIRQVVGVFVGEFGGLCPAQRPARRCCPKPPRRRNDLSNGASWKKLILVSPLERSCSCEPHFT